MLPPWSARSTGAWCPCWDVLFGCVAVPRCSGFGQAVCLFPGGGSVAMVDQGRFGSCTVIRDSASSPPRASAGPGWLLELLPSHLWLSQLLKDASWKPHPEQLLLPSHWPLQAAKEAGKLGF